MASQLDSKTKEEAKRVKQQPSNHWLFIIFAALLCLLPLPHGGEQLHEYLPFALLFFLLLSIAFLQATNNKLWPQLVTELRVPLLFFCLFIALIILQIIPLPHLLLVQLSPASIAVKQLATPSETITSGTISIAPSVTITSLLYYLSYLAVFVLTLVLVNSKKRIFLLLNLVFWSSVIVASYSLLNHFTNGAYSINDPLPPWVTNWTQAARGTLTYKNNYAAWLNMTFFVGFGLAIRTAAKCAKDKPKKLLPRALHFANSSAGFYTLALVIMFLAQLTTSSRGGLVFLGLGLIVTTGLLVVLYRRKFRLKKMIATAFFASALAVVLFQIAGAGMAARFEKNKLGPNGRDHMHNTVFAISKDYPLFGTGAGTYPEIQHAYKTPQLGTTEMSKRAHCDYLELLATTGIAGSLLLILTMIPVLLRIIIGLIRQESKYKAIHLSIAAALFSLFAHAMADWHFPLPLISVHFVMLLAIALRFSDMKKA